MGQDSWTFAAGGDPPDVAGYAVEALDGQVGKVDAAVLDAGTGHLVVSTGPWILGRTVVLPAGAIERVDVAERTVFLARTREQVKAAPAYEGSDDATAPPAR